MCERQLSSDSPSDRLFGILIHLCCQKTSQSILSCQMVSLQQFTLVNKGVYELRSNHYFILIHSHLKYVTQDNWANLESRRRL